MTTKPTRIDPDVFDAAQVVGPTMSRSAAQQVNHWARIGRELELSHDLHHREIASVLAGQRPYDTLPAREQAVVRAEWDERMRATRAELDLAAEFTAAGRSWSEVDANGDLVVKKASGRP
jgi:ParD-like antitoxin of type II bacterial toxin-antitoxin system